MASGFQLRSTQLETAANHVFTYQNDTCAIAASYGELVALDLQTDEVRIFFCKHIKAEYKIVFLPLFPFPQVLHNDAL